MINEAARCLEDGVVERRRDVDFAMVMGTGCAPFRGGPLRYADACGPGARLGQLHQLANDARTAFHARLDVQTLAEIGGTFLAKEDDYEPANAYEI